MNNIDKSQVVSQSATQVRLAVTTTSSPAIVAPRGGNQCQGFNTCSLPSTGPAVAQPGVDVGIAAGTKRMTGFAETSTRATAFVALALLAACTQGSSQIKTASMLPRPQAVVVQDFAVWPGEVQLDPGLSGTIDETLGANQLPPRTAKEQQIGRQGANALAEKLVVEIRDLGFQAQRGGGLPPGATTGLVISGQFVSIDQGNRSTQ
jgi:hypothetical protein